jgi:hypothetical protein
MRSTPGWAALDQHEEGPVIRDEVKALLAYELDRTCCSQLQRMLRLFRNQMTCAARRMVCAWGCKSTVNRGGAFRQPPRAVGV